MNYSQFGSRWFFFLKLKPLYVTYKYPTQYDPLLEDMDINNPPLSTQPGNGGHFRKNFRKKPCKVF